MRALVRVVAVAVVAVAALPVAPAPALAGDPTIIAHRGTAWRPENTLAGVSNAAWRGAATVEVDVRETTDGHLRLLHDTSLDRTTTCTGAISERTAASLSGCRTLERWPWYRRYSARYDGRWRIPGLKAAVRRAEAKGISLLLDVKSGVRNPRLLRHAEGAEVPVTLQVRSVDDVAWLTARTPLPVGYCCSWPGTDTLTQLADAGAAHVAISTGALTSPRVTAAHDRGVGVHTYTVRAQNRWLPKRYRSGGSKRARGDVESWHRELAATGTDSVLADEPDLAP